MPVNPLEQFVNQQRDAFEADLPTGIWDRVSEALADADGDDDQDTPVPGTTQEADQLETFVRRHRPAFEVNAPANWNKLVQQLPGRVVRMVPRSRIYKYRIGAAAAVLLLVATLFVGREMGMRAVAHQEIALIEAVAPDFSEMEGYYQEEIDRSFRQVSQVNQDPLLKADLEAIDRSMAEIRAELLTVPKEERAALIANLIESYQIKLSILQHILNKLPTDGAKTLPENTNQHERKNI